MSMMTDFCSLGASQHFLSDRLADSASLKSITAFQSYSDHDQCDARRSWTTRPLSGCTGRLLFE